MNKEVNNLLSSIKAAEDIKKYDEGLISNAVNNVKTKVKNAFSNVNSAYQNAVGKGQQTAVDIFNNALIPLSNDILKTALNCQKQGKPKDIKDIPDNTKKEDQSYINKYNALSTYNLLSVNNTDQIKSYLNTIAEKNPESFKKFINKFYSSEKEKSKATDIETKLDNKVTFEKEAQARENSQIHMDDPNASYDTDEKKLDDFISKLSTDILNLVNSNPSDPKEKQRKGLATKVLQEHGLASVKDVNSINRVLMNLKSEIKYKANLKSGRVDLDKKSFNGLNNIVKAIYNNDNVDKQFNDLLAKYAFEKSQNDKRNESSDGTEIPDSKKDIKPQAASTVDQTKKDSALENLKQLNSIYKSREAQNLIAQIKDFINALN